MPKPRKTGKRRTSALQRRILDFVRANPRARYADIRRHLGLKSRCGSVLYDSIAVLMERGLLARDRREITVVIKRKRQVIEYRPATVRESLRAEWREAYRAFPEKGWQPLSSSG